MEYMYCGSCGMWELKKMDQGMWPAWAIAQASSECVGVWSCKCVHHIWNMPCNGQKTFYIYTCFKHIHKCTWHVSVTHDKDERSKCLFIVALCWLDESSNYREQWANLTIKTGCRQIVTACTWLQFLQLLPINSFETLSTCWSPCAPCSPIRSGANKPSQWAAGQRAWKLICVEGKNMQALFGMCMYRYI